MRYPLAKPYIGKEEKKAVAEVLCSGVLALGPKTEEFEKRFAKFLGVKYACAVSSGTAGLHLAMIAAGIGPGDEVITTPFSFVASANAILYVGATPVFADIEPVTYNIDPAKIERVITKRTKAILAVHIFGQAADMNPILRLAQRHKLHVIEDACESIGADYHGKQVGTFGESAVFAFYANKQMTTGEGGIIATNDARKDALFRSLRNQGRSASVEWLEHTRLGYNYRMDEMSAALGLVQVNRLPFLLRRRQQIARWYDRYLGKENALFQIPRVAPNRAHTYFVYVIRLAKPERRKATMDELRREGVATKPYLPSIHLMPFYRARFGFRRGNFPVCEAVSDSALALPFYPGLTESDARRISAKVITTIAKCVSKP